MTPWSDHSDIRVNGAPWCHNYITPISVINTVFYSKSFLDLAIQLIMHDYDYYYDYDYDDDDFDYDYD